MDDLAKESLGVFFQGFKDYKKKVKEIFLDVNTTLLLSSLGTQEDITVTAINDPNEEDTEVQIVDVPPTNSEVNRY